MFQGQGLGELLHTSMYKLVGICQECDPPIHPPKLASFLTGRQMLSEKELDRLTDTLHTLNFDTRTLDRAIKTTLSYYKKDD